MLKYILSDVLIKHENFYKLGVIPKQVKKLFLFEKERAFLYPSVKMV